MKKIIISVLIIQFLMQFCYAQSDNVHYVRKVVDGQLIEEGNYIQLPNQLMIVDGLFRKYESGILVEESEYIHSYVKHTKKYNHAGILIYEAEYFFAPDERALDDIIKNLPEDKIAGYLEFMEKVGYSVVKLEKTYYPTGEIYRIYDRLKNSFQIYSQDGEILKEFVVHE